MRDKYLSKLLIVVDMQNDFITGSLPIPGAEELPAKIAAYIQRQQDDRPTTFGAIFTMDTHDLGYLHSREGKYLPVIHCVKNTPGWCIADELFSYADENYVLKNDFALQNWRAVLDEFKYDVPGEIEICGVATDICVVSNALMLRNQFPNATIKVLADLCGGTTPEKHAAALSVMESCQIEIVRG